jgi:hypothetical protein
MPISLFSVCVWLLTLLPYFVSALFLTPYYLEMLTSCPVDAMGILAFASVVASGMSLGVFPPSDPPIVPSPDAFLAGAVATKSDMIFTVPRFLELWASQEEDVNALKTFRTVNFGGGPLGHDVGQHLVDQGVKLVNYYGTTEIGGAVPHFYGQSLMHLECGVVLMSRTDADPYPEWEFFTLARKSNLHLRPVEGETDEFELVYLVCSMRRKPLHVSHLRQSSRPVHSTQSPY